MPIVDIEVLEDADNPASLDARLQTLADRLGELFASDTAGTWIRLRYLARTQYAENDVAVGADVRPTFVTILKARLPQADALRAEAKQVAMTVGAVLDRPHANVHVLYAPAGEGRIAFGGELLEAR